jgi:spore coat protein U-like protein
MGTLWRTTRTVTPTAQVMKKSLRLVTLAGCVVAAVLCVPRPAHAACTITTTNMAFGNYNVFSTTALNSTSTITYRCGTDSNISVMLSTGSSGSFNPRTMLRVAEPLNYNLYRNAARTNIWGDGTGGTQYYTRANPPNDTNVVLTVYGRIPALQDVSAGGYLDYVTATINF